MIEGVHEACLARIKLLREKRYIEKARRDKKKIKKIKFLKREALKDDLNWIFSASHEVGSFNWILDILDLERLKNNLTQLVLNATIDIYSD